MDVFKLVAVGDNGCGKNVMLITYMTGKYPREYVPTVSIVAGDKLFNKLNGHDMTSIVALGWVKWNIYSSYDTELVSR